MSLAHVIVDVFTDTPLQGTSWRCSKAGRAAHRSELDYLCAEGWSGT
jgi:hypothetical protein